MAKIKKPPQSKKELYAKYREHHNEEFIRLNAKDAYYSPKVFWTDKETGNTTIGIFESEFKKGVDIYVEQINTSSEIISPTGRRDLYVLNTNPYYEREYPLNEKIKEVFEK